MSAAVMPADALVVHVAGDDLGAEGDGGDDRGLGPGVEALDVGRRVALGEAERLRLGERDAVVGALLGHLGEDEVGGAVDDAHHPADRLAAQALAERADERDAAGDGGLEQQVDAGRRRPRRTARCRRWRAAPCSPVTTGLPLRERGGDQLAGRLDAADDLDDEVDRRGRSTTAWASRVSTPSGERRRRARG